MRWSRALAFASTFALPACQLDRDLGDDDGRDDRRGRRWVLDASTYVGNLAGIISSRSVDEKGHCLYHSQWQMRHQDCVGDTPCGPDMNWNGFHRFAFSVPDPSRLSGLFLEITSTFRPRVCVFGPGGSECQLAETQRKDDWTVGWFFIEDAEPGSDWWRTVTDVVITTDQSYQAGRQVLVDQPEYTFTAIPCTFSRRSGCPEVPPWLR